MTKKSIIWGLAAAAVTLLLAAGNARAETETETETETVLSFVSPAWVAQHSGDENVRILDVRQDPHDYFRAHVPHAVYLADETLRAPDQGIPVQYLPPQLMSAVLERAGVGRDKIVVIYAEGKDVLGATMTAYVLEQLGHPRVMIMNGGWSAYSARYPTTQQYPRYVRGKLPVRQIRIAGIGLSTVLRLLGAPGVTFVDARPGPAYRGEIDTWMRNGHIPGALSLDWHTLVMPDNLHRLKPKAELRRIFAAHGLTPRSHIVFYCGTSREATVNYMVAKHVLGFPNVRLYEGSWTEYAAYPALPVAKGPRPGTLQRAESGKR